MYILLRIPLLSCCSINLKASATNHAAFKAVSPAFYCAVGSVDNTTADTTMRSKLQAAVQCALFATLGSGSWLTVSSLFNQLVVMLPHIEPSQRGYIFSLMNVAIQASKLPALVYASRKLTVRMPACGNLCSQSSSIPPGTQALRLCGTFS